MIFSLFRAKAHEPLFLKSHILLWLRHSRECYQTSKPKLLVNLPLHNQWHNLLVDQLVQNPVIEELVVHPVIDLQPDTAVPIDAVADLATTAPLSNLKTTIAPFILDEEV